jgi:hypothetical protein
VFDLPGTFCSGTRCASYLAIQQNRKRLYMNKIIKIIVVAFCLIAPVHAKGLFSEITGQIIGSVVGKAGGKASVNSNDMEKVLVEMTKILNKDLPRDISEYKRLDTTAPGPGLRFTYIFTLLKDTSKSVTRTDITNYLQQESQLVKSGFCTNPKTLFIAKNGVTASYSYRLSDGVFMGEFDVTPKDCGY